MDFLKDSDHKPLTLWHGTCADFDVFYPLSQFAVDKHISDSAEFYTSLRSPAEERFHEDYDKKIIQELKEDMKSFLVRFPSKPVKKEKRPDFKIIPVHLRMKNPLVLSCWGFDLEPQISEMVWAVLKKKGGNPGEEETFAWGDFIFKDAYQNPISDIKNELAKGHLFSLSKKEDENRYHLCAQRFIFFMEKMGYDGILYDEYMPEAVDAWREGKIKNFDQRAYIIFHPDQVVRLDKKIEIPVIRPNAKEKIELNKIWYKYQQKHQPQKIGLEQKLKRLEFLWCIKNNLHSR